MNGKVAIITGASRGIGAATARAFAAAGAAVALAARDEQALGALAEEITGAGGRAVAVPTDARDPQAVERLVADTLAALGRLIIAVNNAAGGGQRPTPITQTPVEDFDAVLATSLRGVFLCLTYQIPAMLEGGGGAIPNMSSTAGLEAVGGLAGYVASKHAVIGLTRTAALEYADQGIRVNALAPGPILTDALQGAGEQMQRRVGMAMPMRRVGRPEEVAAAALGLCSDQASYITGTTLRIDGGKLAGMAPFATDLDAHPPAQRGPGSA